MRGKYLQSNHTRAVAALAAVLGLGIGWLDLHTTEVVVTVLPLLAAGLLLGVLQPESAWRWALLLAGGLSALAVVARVLGVSTAEPVRLDPRVTLAAAAFALAGCYIGVAIRRFAGSGTSR